MKKLLTILVLSLFFFVVPIFALEQINIKFNKTNTMCKVISTQKTIDTSKCDSIVVFKNKIYCILK